MDSVLDHRHRIAFRPRFFLAMSAAILLIVLIGFARTLYLRPFFDVPAIPAYVYLHGLVLTAWFVWLVMQASLIGGGRVRLHRTLGVAGAVLGVAVVAVSAVVTVELVARLGRLGINLDMEGNSTELARAVLGQGVAAGATVLDFTAQIVWANAAAIVTFSVLLAGAIGYRRRGDVHKRLMLLASISLLGPAIARIARWPGLGGDFGPLVPMVWLVLLGALLAHDYTSTRRLHGATLAGAAFVLVISTVGGAIASTEIGREFVRWLS